jgi:hypothetical protein
VSALLLSYLVGEPRGDEWLGLDSENEVGVVNPISSSEFILVLCPTLRCEGWDGD